MKKLKSLNKIWTLKPRTIFLKGGRGALRVFKKSIRKSDIFCRLKSDDFIDGDEFIVKFKTTVSDKELTTCQIYNGNTRALFRQQNFNFSDRYVFQNILRKKAI